MPVYNEKETVAIVIEKVLALPCDKQVIVVDDGSTDGTRDILKSLQNQRSRVQNEQCLKIIFQEKNQGKGASIRKGIEEADGQYVVFQDADLELEPEEILRLSRTAGPGVPVVYGSRFLNPVRMPLLSLLANRFLTFLTNLLYGSRITDMETCYKFCSASLVRELKLHSNGFEIEPEITCKILRKGYKIAEVPVTYRPRIKGKKISWIDGVKAVFFIFKYRVMR